MNFMLPFAAERWSWVITYQQILLRPFHFLWHCRYVCHEYQTRRYDQWLSPMQLQRRFPPKNYQHQYLFQWRRGRHKPEQQMFANCPEHCRTSKFCFDWKHKLASHCDFPLLCTCVYQQTMYTSDHSYSWIHVSHQHIAVSKIVDL